MITPNLIYEQSINDNTDPIYSNFSFVDILDPGGIIRKVAGVKPKPKAQPQTILPIDNPSVGASKNNNTMYIVGAVVLLVVIIMFFMMSKK
ncbi:MAG: hypothetical protein K0B10_07165 [Vicingaceae bacterium]|nr:hypothetical protein [Vicingaceae bacterium]